MHPASRWIGPVALPDQGETFSGSATVSGWGMEYYGGPGVFPDVLQNVEVPLVSDEGE